MILFYFLSLPCTQTHAHAHTSFCLATVSSLNSNTPLFFRSLALKIIVFYIMYVLIYLWYTSHLTRINTLIHSDTGPAVVQKAYSKCLSSVSTNCWQRFAMDRHNRSKVCSWDKLLCWIRLLTCSATASACHERKEFLGVTCTYISQVLGQGIILA